MTNEIATRDEQAVALPAPQPTNELMEWVESARQANLVAQSLANTSFAGAYRGKPDEITAAILTGQELGLQPMTALKSIDVIQGQPALRAHAMRAIVQHQGHDIELVESDDTHCVMRGRRKGAETWQAVTWDIPRAQRLGLLGKDQWKKQPKTMLIARATGELCRLIASDALHGLPYAAEEVDGYVHGEVAPAKAPLSVAALTSAPEPQQDASTPADVVDVDTDDDHAAALHELRDFGRQQGIDDIEALAHEELGAPVEHVSAQAIRDLVARLHKAIAA
ncbi:hypothetical protein ASD97_24620 [Streptomyces sp. Root63]|uniref:hypothetical protein n=1 Tax=Streptomyces TaxID=1883 RepID=UPI0006F33552|nr:MULTISPECIES: hypothetical protein [unclassified Streptomyces]KQX27490.1 hypothetical protein ASD29_29850 [Streptomyces sp. Root1295]KRA34730.1 hypothetical protein ASD97_24620 [Streptomyces sp. Root63]WTC69756.1 hypothetical protein OG882_05180 [Streptomyces anulatus]